MKKPIKALCLLLALMQPLQLCGCAAMTARAADLMEGISSNEMPAAPLPPKASAAAADFAVRLFRTGYEKDRNTLISPLSVLCALSMTANGAEGETLFQMESTLGMRRDLYNVYFKSLNAALSDDASGTLKLANSVWFKEDPELSVKQEFLQTNADYYGADVFQAPFDSQMPGEINGWVKEHTDGMIPEILDQIPENAVMYLVNALAFDAKWAEPYREGSVQSGLFFCDDGTKRTVDFLHSAEHIYLENENAVGFLKYYQGGKYAFAGLLPKEGVNLEECLASLSGASLQGLLTGARSETVYASLPKFGTEYGTELSGVLQSMGMELPFDRVNADFTGITDDPDGVCISRVLHNTVLSVTEQGTRAGAATAVEMMVKSAALDVEPKQVVLDRPFVYLLLDCETQLPLFIGTMLYPPEA